MTSKIAFVDGRPYWVKTVVSGGMGEVYLLEETEPRHSLVYLPRLAAKTFKSDVSPTAIRNELRIWLSLHHPNILPLRAIGTIDDELAALSPWRTNGTLDTLKADQISASLLASIIAQTVSALDHAWTERQILHLDIKPSNLFFGPLRSAIQLGDWGIAQLASSREIAQQKSVPTLQSVAGTLPYMGPERFLTPAGLTPQTDMFSLGVLAYRLITGSVPFNAQTPMLEQLLSCSYLKVVAETLPSPWFQWKKFLLTCLAPTPEDRPKNYERLLAQIPR